jgi:hypothetical protein
VGITGTCTVVASQAGDTSYNPAASVSRSFSVVTILSQTITFAALADRALAQLPFTVSASASSGLAVTFTSTTSAVCTSGGVHGSTITIVGITGTCTVVASQAGDTSYNPAASVNRSFSVVTILSQTITFAALPNRTLIESPFTVSATASSGLAVTFSSTTPAVCGVAGNQVTLLATGACTVQASQVGNASYNPAASVNRSFTVSKASQSITFPSLTTHSLAQSTVTVSATASSELAVTFTTTTPAVCTPGGVNGADIALLTLGTCVVRASQAGNATYSSATSVNRSFSVVTNLSQTITFAAIADRTLAQAALTLNATASSGLPVSYTDTTPGVCSLNGTTVTLLTVGTCTIQADQAGDLLYTPAPAVIRSFSVTKASQTITFAALANRAVAQSPFTVSATASSGLVVSFSTTTPGVCTVAGNLVTLHTTGTCTIVASQAGNTVYAAATPVNRSFTVT